MHIRRLARRSLGRQFGWLWAAYAVSAYGSGLALGAFPLIAVLALHSGPAQVSALSAVGPAVGALIAVPLAPWAEFRRKRPVMISMDLSRFGALATIPVAYAFGWLSFVQLLIISAVTAAAKIAFNAASGSYLKTLVRPDDLLVANARFESTNWSSLAVGPPLGGAAIGLFGPVTTVAADALSYLFSALGITAIRGHEQTLRRAEQGRVHAGDLVDGWRYILAHPVLRALWLTVIAVELAIIISMSLYNPVLATYRLEHTPRHRVARVLSAWSIGSQASIAGFTALGGLLAGITSPRTALAAAGLLILVSPLLLPRRPSPAPEAERKLATPVS